MTTVRVVLPAHLRGLANVQAEVTVEVPAEPTISDVLDALEADYSALIGTIRDQITGIRRPYMRYIACREDLSHDPPNAPLPESVATGAEALLIVGAIAGGEQPPTTHPIGGTSHLTRAAGSADGMSPCVRGSNDTSPHSSG